MTKRVTLKHKLDTKTILFIDMDKTLIRPLSHSVHPKGMWDIEFKFDTLSAIAALNPQYIFIVSNQGGIETGRITEQWVKIKMDFVTMSVKDAIQGNYTIAYAYAKTNKTSDRLRKPNTGMLEDCLRLYDLEHVPKGKMLMIGDASGGKHDFSDSDLRCAENFGIDYLDVNDFVSPSVWKKNASPLRASQLYSTYKTTLLKA